MADIGAMRDGIKARLATIAGLRAHDTIPGQINPPAALVKLVSIEYDSAMARGLDEYEFAVRLYVAPNADAQSQDKLDGYLASSGAGSVKAAIEGDRTLGGAAETCRVLRVGEAPTLFEHGGVSYIGAEISIRVWARGS